jgi:hypothetical protein
MARNDASLTRRDRAHAGTAESRAPEPPASRDEHVDHSDHHHDRHHHHDRNGPHGHPHHGDHEPEHDLSRAAGRRRYLRHVVLRHRPAPAGDATRGTS